MIVFSRRTAGALAAPPVSWCNVCVGLAQSQINKGYDPRPQQLVHRCVPVVTTSFGMARRSRTRRIPTVQLR